MHSADDATPCCVCAKCYNEPTVDSWTHTLSVTGGFMTAVGGPVDTTLLLLPQIGLAAVTMSAN